MSLSPRPAPGRTFLTASSATSNGTKAASKSGGSSFSAADGFGLTGPSIRLDPQINAYRGDIADHILDGRILAPHYSRALIRACCSRSAAVRTGPDGDAACLSELLPGEAFAVHE